MFDSLSDRIKQDEHVGEKPAQRFVYWALVIVISCALFGGLYFGVKMLQ